MLRAMTVDTSWGVCTWSGSIMGNGTNFAALTFATKPASMPERPAFVTLQRAPTESDERVELGSN